MWTLYSSKFSTFKCIPRIQQELSWKICQTRRHDEYGGKLEHDFYLSNSNFIFFPFQRLILLTFLIWHVLSFIMSFLFHFFQNSLIKRIKGENVYVKHSNLMLEVGIGIYQCMLVCVGFPPGAHLWARTMMHEGCVLTCDYVWLTSLLPLIPSCPPRCRSPFLCVYLF